MSDNTNNEFVQHGIEDTPLNDTQKGAELEALAGGAAGAFAGAPPGTMGVVVGALLGSSINTVASGEPMQPIDFEGDWDAYSARGSDTTAADGSSETTSASETVSRPASGEDIKTQDERQ